MWWYLWIHKKFLGNSEKPENLRFSGFWACFSSCVLRPAQIFFRKTQENLSSNKFFFKIPRKMPFLSLTMAFMWVFIIFFRWVLKFVGFYSIFLQSPKSYCDSSTSHRFSFNKNASRRDYFHTIKKPFAHTCKGRIIAVPPFLYTDI